MSDANPLGERRPIRIDDVRWERYRDPLRPDAPGPEVRWLVDPASGNRVMQVRSAPGARAPAHWHLSDTVDPDVSPPPLGRWDDPTTWVDGYPQLERQRIVETLLAERSAGPQRSAAREPS